MRSPKQHHSWKSDNERRKRLEVPSAQSSPTTTTHNHNNSGYHMHGNPHTDSHEDYSLGLCGYILLILSYAIICLTFPFSLTVCLKVVQEYERAVMFRLGRILGGAKGPGLFIIIPCVDAYTKVDLRTITFDVPPQEILTKDSVTVAVDAVVYFRVFDPVISITNVEDAPKSTQLLAATSLRNVLGTEGWGVRVERVEVKDVRLPVQLQRAMAAEAEAAREARAKVIAAEGEQKASRALKDAADVIMQSPTALQLRYLQTLTTIASEKNSTIVFPIPIELMQAAITSYRS
ncbi:unnamed protein product [Adineta steineri]|uniref:Band 7 domain-containing protein n=1 Tax=Adineta steineri TaxID=433720 RepID=A0A814MRB9_9BILA|nr:unnamed protein product [Adineta steineri]CAF1043929.1 unnamed protein product [Adineta steineri]CAF1082933.1 unnamed protein product [Adineta steineri]